MHAPIANLAGDPNFVSAIATFHFGDVDGAASVPPARQRKFKSDFCREAANLHAWLVTQQWSPAAPIDLQVLVSDAYRISRSLVPAWSGQPGRMEFPAARVLAGEAALMHELTHVYLPNGNRLLAEGLAVYLQTEIGGNPAFPNFGTPLHALVGEYLGALVSGFAHAAPENLELISLAKLDAIATPHALELSIGQQRYGPDHQGTMACTYAIAGSFVQFLIEAHGTDKLAALFQQTPLAPLEYVAGSPRRWNEVYGLSLAELEQQWKLLIAGRAHRTSRHNGSVSGERGQAPRQQPRLDKKAKT